MTRPPVALTIAGSDPSGGAGIQADLKTFSALGAYGTSVLTALTAQSTRGVTGVHVVPTQFVSLQLRTLVADVAIDAVKIGMLATADMADLVGAFLREHPFDVVVLDPVMVATSGDRLLDDDAVAAVRRLLPLASVVTPNVPETAALLDVARATSPDELLAQGRELVTAGANAVLLKGGHLVGPTMVDQFVSAEGVFTVWHDRVQTNRTHGTGCSLSSALAALRPQRDSWECTVRDATGWLHEAIRRSDELHVGSGNGPVHHFHAWWP
ncbi:MAG TPA: bifunctional hydroxymethylpyrimidine kinase/phosphomethylpyrimidine kinase [Dermatophilaceae bacterium]|nr:bifunctional hydroxymethylpyrimidine kinase/phosphomethylpyrimidine kinase [Dermatophilaceae bacterium]